MDIQDVNHGAIPQAWRREATIRREGLDPAQSAGQSYHRFDREEFQRVALYFYQRRPVLRLDQRV